MGYVEWLDSVEREVVARAGMWSPVMASAGELWALYVGGLSPRHAAARVAAAWDGEGTQLAA